MKTFRKFIAALPLALGLSLAQASGGGYPLDHFPVEKLTDVAALQSGAKLFVNYCLNCHGASSMRYNRLQDIGLTEDQIRKNLLFSAEKVGEQMKVAITPDDAKEWFGALPPDLSVIARARASGSGSEWLTAPPGPIRSRPAATTTTASVTPSIGTGWATVATTCGSSPTVRSSPM